MVVLRHASRLLRRSSNVFGQLRVLTTSMRNGASVADPAVFEAAKQRLQAPSALEERICESCRTRYIIGSEEREFPAALDAESLESLMPYIDTFIFDADGVLWLGDSLIEGAPQFFDFLLQRGKLIIVLTNNSTKSRVQMVKKLCKMGFATLKQDQIVNPAAVVTSLLLAKGFAGEKRVYVIGQEGLLDELGEAGIDYFGNGPDPIEGRCFNNADLMSKNALIYRNDFGDMKAEVGAVVVGFEKNFNYVKLMRAANFLQEEDCLFIGTNEDEICPGPFPKTVIPDTGPILAAVRTAAGREPTIVGKPHAAAFDFIRERFNIEPSRAIMIGDRTNTDVCFGRRNGLKTLMVLSGCHTLDDIKQHQQAKRNDFVPDFYAPSLAYLI